MNLARLGNKYLTETEPWKLFKTDPVRVQTILNIALQICANLAVVGQPFLPFTAQKIRTMLNMSDVAWSDAGRMDILPPHHAINKAVLLFEKIEDDQIQYQIDKLQKK
ncbi:hypothetical protein FACS1894201_09470 [Bacteroidia bacterium]|nr:hypothetical protein FACS1894201_09470 [Bacteroidia bacterium]